MKEKLGKLSLLLVIMALVVMTACSNNGGGSAGNGEKPAAGGNENASAAKLDPVELKVMLFGDKPIDMDKVLTEFENRTKDTLNTKLNIEWNPASDHKQKMKLKMSAGEEVDLAFDAGWMNLNQHVSQGLYLELDKYFNNDEYPGLKAAFSEDFLESNKLNGHIYAIPLTNSFYDIEGIYIRKDLREKYGLDVIDSYEDLQVYFDKVRENNPEMTPLMLGARGYWKVFGNFDSKQTNFRSAPFSINGTGVIFNVILSEDGKQVLGATTLGDPESEFAALPAPFNSSDFFYGSYDKKVEWTTNYAQKDILNEKDAKSLFVAGKSAANEGTIGGFAAMEQSLKQSIPEAELEVFVYNEPARKMLEGGLGTDYRAWNDIVIPVTSKNPDRVMKFVDWLFQSQDNHDLFELGIEGEHWTKDGDRYFKMTDKSSNYVFPGYQLTWNPTMSRINSNNEESVLKMIEYSTKAESYYPFILSGFTFNTEPVKTEIAKVQPRSTQSVDVMNAGLDPNWRANAEKMNTELRSLGLEKIRAELVKQVQEYLDNGGK